MEEEQPRPGSPAGEAAPPTATRYIVNDTTSEALIRVLSENPRGVLAVNDELVAWFKSFDAYRNGRGGDVGRWLSMWSGGPLTVDRKGSETIHVPSACVSITGTIQPQTLRDTLGVSLIENGMAARLLFAMPARRTLKWSDKEIPAATNESMQSLYATLTQLRFNENDGRPSSVLVPMTADAEQLWVKFFGDWAAEQAAATDEQAAMMSKLVAYAARFALLFHMIQVAAGDREAIDEEAVDEQNIVAATHLARWFADEAARIHAMLSESGDQRRTRELVELCQAAGGEVSVRDLQRRRFRADAEGIRDDLKGLESMGFGRLTFRQTGPQGGRQAEVFELSADLCDTTLIPALPEGVLSMSQSNNSEKKVCIEGKKLA